MSVDLYLRAITRTRWLTVATNRGIYTGSLDENGQPIVNYERFAVDEIGAATISPAIVDAEGNVTTPAVMDTWHSVNLRIHGKGEADDADTLYPGETGRLKFLRSKLARFIREQATLVNLNGIRAYQWGVAANRIQLLDPRDIPQRERIWFGGMEP